MVSLKKLKILHYHFFVNFILVILGKRIRRKDIESWFLNIISNIKSDYEKQS